MKRIIFLFICFGLLSPAYAEVSYREQLRRYKLIYIQLLEKKIEKIPVGTTVEVFFKDGTVVKGFFKSYSSCSDALWIQPLDAKFGFLSDEAFDIRQIQDVTIIVLRNI